MLAAQGPPAGGDGGGRGGGRGTPIPAGESCPPGTTEIRPRSCMAPDGTPPSILDYRPKSTLIVPVHLVPTAKYPAIDFHGHPGNLIASAEGLASLKASLDSLNVRMMISADNLSGDRLKSVLTAVAASAPMKERVRILAGINFRNVGPEWAAGAIKQLDADIAAGAVGVGEIPKSLGLSVRKPDGSRLRIDDPELDPDLGRVRAARHSGVHPHRRPAGILQADRLHERALARAFAVRGPAIPAGQVSELRGVDDRAGQPVPQASQDDVRRRAHGVARERSRRAGKMFDEMPNVYTEVGAVLYDIGRQPRTAHDFFIKYQDRILFGKDSFQPEEYPYYWRVFETDDDYFDYYRRYHAFWKLYGIGLPDDVLKKVYYENALKITKGIPQNGWPK